MSVERPDFLQAYEAMEVPEPIISNEAHDKTVEVAASDFFEAIRKALGLGQFSYDNFFEQETKVMDPDSLEVFRRRGGQVIASVLRMSDAPGTITTRFKRHHLTDETKQAIRAMTEAELIEHGLK